MSSVDRVVIVKARKGEVLEKRIVNGEFHKVLKEIANKALNEWDPEISNFDVIKYEYEVEKQLPLKPEELDIVLKFNPKRFKDKVLFRIPVYIISYKNYRVEDHVVDEEVYVVGPYTLDEYVSIIEETAVMATGEYVERGSE